MRAPAVPVVPRRRGDHRSPASTVHVPYLRGTDFPRKAGKDKDGKLPSSLSLPGLSGQSALLNAGHFSEQRQARNARPCGACRTSAQGRPSVARFNGTRAIPARHRLPRSLMRPWQRHGRRCAHPARFGRRIVRTISLSVSSCSDTASIPAPRTSSKEWFTLLRNSRTSRTISFLIPRFGSFAFCFSR